MENKIQNLIKNYESKELLKAYLQKEIKEYIEFETDYDEFFQTMNLEDQVVDLIIQENHLKDIINRKNIKILTNKYMNLLITDYLEQYDPDSLECDYKMYPEDL